jgi:P-type Cu+ transporter
VKNESGNNLVSASGSSWLTAAIESRKRRRRHLQTCEACKSKGNHRASTSPLIPLVNTPPSQSFQAPVDDPLPMVSSSLQATESYRASFSIGGMTCAACVNAIMDALKDKPGLSELNVDLLGKCGSAILKRQDIADEIKDIIETIGYECDLVGIENVAEKSSDSVDTYKAQLSIGGMTCSSCESAITRTLSSLDFVQSVDITLLGHSGTVAFSTRENVAQIKAAVEEMGYDCDIVGLFKLGSQLTASNTRTISIKVDGMFCQYNPSCTFTDA